MTKSGALQYCCTYRESSAFKRQQIDTACVDIASSESRVDVREVQQAC